MRVVFEKVLLRYTKYLEDNESNVKSNKRCN